LRGALARRRAIWLTHLVDASVLWTEPGTAGARLILIDKGEVIVNADIDNDTTPPIPPGYARPVAARREASTLERFDRLRVLTAELKRLVAPITPTTAAVLAAIRSGVTPTTASIAQRMRTRSVAPPVSNDETRQDLGM
jgi:hypothetical protein